MMLTNLAKAVIGIIKFNNPALPVYDANKEFNEVLNYASFNILLSAPTSPFENIQKTFKKSEDEKTFQHLKTDVINIRINFVGEEYEQNLKKFQNALLNDATKENLKSKNIGYLGTSSTMPLAFPRTAKQKEGVTVTVTFSYSEKVNIESQIIKKIDCKQKIKQEL